MRLLHTETIELKEFFDRQRPRYAILSHRWEGSETTFHDFITGKHDKKSFEKIRQAAEHARSRGLQWVWIDTCCIDKSSSAELNEAINSMYLWYQEAEECYVYLNDVRVDTDSDLETEITSSKWWTRGWTLQELLAPRAVHFFDAAWQKIGDKISLQGQIEKASRIPKEFLNGETDLGNASVAMKMSWAAMRETTRIEDMAYCLLGIFNVNMPLLYGEREKAFFRLQLEIVRNNDDESIFAWKAVCNDEDEKPETGMLATWPSQFANSGSVRSLALRPENRPPWA